MPEKALLLTPDDNGLTIQEFSTKYEDTGWIATKNGVREVQIAP